jgi:hypothetical protein
MVQTQMKNVRGATTTNPLQQTYQGGSSVYNRARDVLGVQESYSSMRQPVVSCTTDRKVLLTWTGSGSTVQTYHVFYGTVNGAWQHSKPNISGRDTQTEIGGLNTCHKYFYEVLAIGVDGRTWWLQPRVVNP